MSKRNEILKLRKTKTLKQIGVLYGVTGERIRQIIEDKKPEGYCKTHKCHFFKDCRYCGIHESYSKLVDKIIKDDLMEEIDRLVVHDRRKEIIIQKRLLVRKLRDKYNFTFTQIAKLLERDRTTMRHLYYNN